MESPKRQRIKKLPIGGEPARASCSAANMHRLQDV